MIDDQNPDAASAAGGDGAEAALWFAVKTQGSLLAREKLFSIYLPFARQVAKRHFLDRSGGDIEYTDLCQLACAGLLEAIDGYNPDFGAAFKTYASRRISGSILDGIAKTSELREQLSFRNRIRNERARSLSGLDADTLAASETMQALANLAIGLALGYMLDGESAYAVQGQADARPNAYESLAWKEMVVQALSEVQKLPEREQAVMQHHYLNGLTFEQIGALLGVTKGRISQLHSAAIERLRKRLPRAGDFHLER